MRKRRTLLGRFLLWRTRHLSDQQFMILLSVIVGVASGFSAVIIKYAVYFIRFLLTNGFSKEYYNYLYFIYPAIGIFATVIFIRYILKQYVGDGVPKVLHSISTENGYIKPHNVYSSIVTSALTIGFGGSVGLEGPTVATGGAIGSNLARLLHLNYKQTILLLGCASAAAMSAIFKAPIAAVIFAVEVIMLDLTMNSIVPLLVASATGALISYTFLGMDVLCPFKLKETFMMHDIPLYIVLGIFSGFVSLYYIRVYEYIFPFFNKIKKWYKKLFIGGAILGVLIFLFPSLYGEGYDSINSCLNGDYSYLFNNSFYYIYKDNIVVIMILFLLILLLKIVATSITFGSGGIGGMFAPTLFTGANLGFFLAVMYNYFSPGHISESNFALVGMAGLISGVIHAPLTAIFLIAEITNGYSLFMPLIIVSAISYSIIKFFEPNSVYTIQLAERGELFTHNKDKAVLSLMKVEKLVETNFKTINEDANLGELVKVISESERDVFPVVDDDNTFKGLVFLGDIRHIIFEYKKYDTTYVRNLMFMPTTYVTIDDSMEEVAKKFRATGNYNLPVLNNGKYLGFVSRANVFSKYRSMLKQFSED